MLYLVSTPIGNLEDITLRAISTLKEVDLILCEDTRTSSTLLKKYQIDTPCLSFHKFNEQKRLTSILKMLEDGKNIALVSDAGTPLINDPGFNLIKSSIEEKIKFTAIPGSCSIIDALIMSGLSTTPFQFIGFLPKKGNFLKKLLYYPGTTIAFESPNRLKSTIIAINELDPNRKVVIARELTKKFEEIISGNPSELISFLEKQTKLGEVVLLIGENESYSENEKDYEIIEAFKEYFGLSTKDAIKYAAKVLKKPKREVYKTTNH